MPDIPSSSPVFFGAGQCQAKPVRVFGFGQIAEAHRVMEEGTAGGKMVVAVG